jgi:hypothetical protein
MVDLSDEKSQRIKSMVPDLDEMGGEDEGGLMNGS